MVRTVCCHEHRNEYDLKEAAGRLGWACTTLRDRCTTNTVPHHRRHSVKGIFFTDDDIAKIKAPQPRQPALTPPTGALPSSDREDQTGEDAEIDAALAALAGPTRVSSDG